MASPQRDALRGGFLLRELSEVAGFRRAGHYGDIPGFAADVGFYPDLGLGIVTLANTDFGAANPPRDLERTVLADPAFATAHS